MMNYYRITGYDPETNICFIADSNGKFEKLWQFSAYLISKGMQIVAVSKPENFSDGNIPRVPFDSKIILRACDIGKPIISNKQITVKNKFYQLLP